MNFLHWLTEIEDKGYNYYKNLLLGKLNLDQTHGLTQQINGWQPERLINTLNTLGEFKELPQDVQTQVIGQIRSGQGTLGDLVRIMASPPRVLAPEVPQVR